MNKALIIVFSLILTFVAGFIIRTQIYYHATPSYLDQISNNSWLNITEDRHYITITPNSWDTSYTMLFYPWAKVDSRSYIYKLWTIALEQNLTIIIDKPLAHLQIFGVNNADLVSWNNLIIAGHSLWGAMACEYVAKNPSKISALILMWAYCNSNISDLTGLQTLSFAASQDGLIWVEKMKSYDHNLPVNHVIYVLSWATHAQYGNYWAQDGDGVNTISDDQVLEQLSDGIGKFITTLAQ